MWTVGIAVRKNWEIKNGRGIKGVLVRMVEMVLQKSREVK